MHRMAYRPIELMLQILVTVHELYPSQLRWGARPPYTFDLDMGTDQVRIGVVAGQTPEQIEQAWEPGLARFLAARDRYLLYR